jgi:hypothetical protein
MGNLLGGPLGGFVSLGVGILLQFLFPQKVEGPRQDNTKATTNKFGDPIGHTHGTVRIAGSYIWLEGDKIKEKKRTYRAGKGGPIVTEYSYVSTSMAIFDWTGPVAAISRVWIDDELAYDNTTEALQNVLNVVSGKGFGKWEGVDFTFYLGTEDQEPDARLVADKGASAASAYRGIVGVVMANLNHEEIGIRMPNIEIEVVRNPSYSYLSKLLTNNDYPSGHNKSGFIDPVNLVAVFYDRSLSGPTVNKAWAYDLSNGKLLWSKKIIYSSGLTGIDGDPYFDLNGVVWFSDRIGQADAYDLFTGARLATYDFDHGWPAINQENYNRVVKGSNGFTYGAFFRGTRVEFRNTLTAGGHVWTVRATVNAGVDSGTSTKGAVLKYDEDADQMFFYIITNYMLYRVSETAVTSVNNNTLHGSGIQGTLVYCLNDDSLLIRSTNGLFKYDADTLALIASTSSYASGSRNSAAEHVNTDKNGVYWFSYDSGGSTYIVKFDAVNFVVLEQFGPTSYTGSNISNRLAYVEGMSGFLALRGSSAKWYVDFLPTVTRGMIPLANILEAECALAGLTVDVSNVTKMARGYAVKDDSTPRGVIEDLCRLYGIDHCQVDGVYTFFERDNVVDLVVDEDHVGAEFKDDGYPQSRVSELIADVMDLPNAFTYSYLAWDAQYRKGSQRIDMPLDSTESLSEGTATTNAALSDTEGARAADILLRESREVPDEYTFNLPPRYARAHPGDVLLLPLEGNKTLRVVINEIEDDLVIKVKAHKRTIDYSSDAIGVATPDIGGTKLNSSVAYFLPMDMNMIRDNDIDNTSGFYFLTYYRGTQEPSSVSVYRSLDGGNAYEGWASLSASTSVGLVLTELPGVLSPYVTYPTAHFDFRLYGGDVPASVTNDEWLDGTLLCAVETTADGVDSEWEVISVLTITDNGDGSHRATGLIRGFRGTENMIGLHETGNRVVWLNAETMARTSSGAVDALQMFVPVASGKLFDSTKAISFTNRGASLKPFRPVDIKGVRDTGNTESLTVTWQRQSRYNYQWLDGTEAVPLNETSEEYEAEIYSGVTLLRTKLALSSPTFTYTLSEYAMDVGGSPTVIPEVRVVIYQISQELTHDNGRGYPGEATL